MLKSKTVFILGAGASYEVGFPLGSDLKKTISNKLNFVFNVEVSLNSGDKDIYSTIRSEFRSRINEYIEISKDISSGILWSNSIDDFIDTHKGRLR